MHAVLLHLLGAGLKWEQRPPLPPLPPLPYACAPTSGTALRAGFMHFMWKPPRQRLHSIMFSGQCPRLQREHRSSAPSSGS